jgi:hypothetical protein
MGKEKELLSFIELRGDLREKTLISVQKDQK